MEAIGVSVAITDGVRDIPSYAVEGGMARHCTVSSARDAMTDDIKKRINGGNWRLLNVRYAVRSRAIEIHRVDRNHISSRCANAAEIRLFRAAAVLYSFDSRGQCDVIHHGQPQCAELYTLSV